MIIGEGHGCPSTALALVPRQSHARPCGVSRDGVAPVHQEYGAVAGKITPRCRNPCRRVIGKKPKTCQTKANGIPPSVT
jgi:hypothetical protein